MHAVCSFGHLQQLYRPAAIRTWSAPVLLRHPASAVHRPRPGSVRQPPALLPLLRAGGACSLRAAPPWPHAAPRPPAQVHRIIVKPLATRHTHVSTIDLGPVAFFVVCSACTDCHQCSPSYRLGTGWVVTLANSDDSRMSSTGAHTRGCRTGSSSSPSSSSSSTSLPTGSSSSLPSLQTASESASESGSSSSEATRKSPSSSSTKS